MPLVGWLGWNGQSISKGSSDMEHEERLKAALAARYRIEREKSVRARLSGRGGDRRG